MYNKELHIELLEKEREILLGISKKILGFCEEHEERYDMGPVLPTKLLTELQEAISAVEGIPKSDEQ